MDPETSHCLAGFVVALTPKAAGYEHLREDVDVFANEILRANSRLPIPLAIFTSDDESVKIVVAGRASEERSAAYLTPSNYEMN